MRMTGEHIVLREFRSEDISAMRQWVTDDQATHFLSGIFIRPQTWEDTDSYLNAILQGNAGGYNFAIADKETMRYLGQCNLLQVDHLAQSAELAIVLARENWGKGYGTEAVKLLVQYAFAHVNLHRVYLYVWADNAAAIRVYEKAGFEKEGILRESGFREGKFRDKIVMSVLRDEAQT